MSVQAASSETGYVMTIDARYDGDQLVRVELSDDEGNELAFDADDLAFIQHLGEAAAAAYSSTEE